MGCHSRSPTKLLLFKFGIKHVCIFHPFFSLRLHIMQSEKAFNQSHLCGDRILLPVVNDYKHVWEGRALRKMAWSISHCDIGMVFMPGVLSAVIMRKQDPKKKRNAYFLYRFAYLATLTFAFRATEVQQHNYCAFDWTAFMNTRLLIERVWKSGWKVAEIIQTPSQPLLT